MSSVLNIKIAVFASCAAFLTGWLYKEATATQCYTELTVIAASTLGFWLFAPDLIIRFSNQTRLKHHHPTLQKIFRHLPKAGFVALTCFAFTCSNSYLIMDVLFQCENTGYMLADLLIKHNIFLYVVMYFVTLSVQTTPVDVSEDSNIITNDYEGHLNKILIRHAGHLISLQVSEITFVKTERNCLFVFTEAKKYVIYQTLSSFLDEHSPTFVQTHKSYAINISLVDKIRFNKNSDGRIRMRNGETIKCSRTYRKNLLNHIKS